MSDAATGNHLRRETGQTKLGKDASPQNRKRQQMPGISTHQGTLSSTIAIETITTKYCYYYLNLHFSALQHTKVHFGLLSTLSVEVVFPPISNCVR